MTDTYHKEIERYGLATMDISEYFFLADSIAIISFLDLIEGDEGERYRWLFALRNIDMLLDDFGYDIEQKFELLIHLQASFYDEFNKDSKTNNLLYRLNTKYRAESKNIERILNPANDTEDFVLAIGYFKERSKQNVMIADDIREVHLSNHHYAKSIEDLLPSYIHMTLNRTFLALPRKHELIIYHYLMKYYESMLARKRVNTKKNTLLVS
jgi:lantibiotic biosynthesis protein